MDANVVPTLRDAIQEIVALCIHGAPRDTEANEWFDMTQGKFKLLPRIQAYNGTPDHEYLGILIKLRDDLDDHSLNALQLVTKLITDQVALMRFKDADLERLLSATNPANPLAVRSVGLRDTYLDIDGNVKPLYLSLDVTTEPYRYHVVDNNGRTKPYWSRFAIVPNYIRIVVYAGQRIILDPGRLRGVYNKAYFVEMLSPAAAEAFLRQLSSLNLKIAPKTS